MGRGCAELQQAAGKWEDGLEGGSGETGKARTMPESASEGGSSGEKGEMGRTGLGEGRDGMHALILDDAARKLPVRESRARRLGRAPQKARACGRHRLPGEETGATGCPGGHRLPGGGAQLEWLL